MRILNSWYGFKSRIEILKWSQFYTKHHVNISQSFTFDSQLVHCSISNIFQVNVSVSVNRKMVIRAHAICILIIFNTKISSMICIQTNFFFFMCLQCTFEYSICSLFYLLVVYWIECNVNAHRSYHMNGKVCQKGSHLKSIESQAHTFTMYRSNQLNAHHTKSNGFGMRHIEIYLQLLKMS